MHEEIILVPVGLEKFLRHLGGARSPTVTSCTPSTSNSFVALPRKKVGDAQPAFGVLPGEVKSHPLARRAGGLQFAGAVLAACAADEFLGVVDDQIVAIGLHREVAVDDLGLQQLFRDARFCSSAKIGRAFSSSIFRTLRRLNPFS